MQTFQHWNLMANLTAIASTVIIIAIAYGSSSSNVVAAAAAAAPNAAIDGGVIGIISANGGDSVGVGGVGDGIGVGGDGGLNDATTTLTTPHLTVDGNLEFSATADLGETLPAFEPCNVQDASHNECMKGLFHLILPKLKIGLPDYNMASIDPYYYRRGIFRYSNDGIAGGLLIKNMNIHGVSKMKVHNVQSNFNETGFIIKLNLELPRLRADGQFKADVKLGGLRLVPKGPFNITIDHVKINMITDGKFGYNGNGARNLQLSRLNANVALGHTHIEAKNIFSDPNLNERILGLVNLNLPEITRVGIPATRDQWAPIIVTHVNEYFENVPIDKFLLQ